MTSHAIPSRPKTSGTRSLRTVCRPCRRARHFHICGGGRLHRAFCRRWPLAEGQHHATAGTHHRDQLAERPGAGARRHVHPHRAQPDQVEGEFRTQNLFQRGQRVVHPTDVGGTVERFPRIAHCCRRLGRDHLVAIRREPGRIPSGAGAHVEHAGTRIRQQAEHRCVNLLEWEAFVSGR